MTNIPYGYCHCGCGRKTRISHCSDKRRGYVKGESRPYVRGHHGRISTRVVEAQPFKIDGVYCRFITLTRGQITIVDANDYAWLTHYNWCVQWCTGTRSYYARTNLRGVAGKQHNMAMHRMILGLCKGDQREGDHIESGNTLDNRRKNLRIVTHHQNSTNRRKRSNTKAGLKGVSWHSRDNVWAASIRIHGRLRHLGTFRTAKDAHTAYRIAATEQFGEYARFA